MNERDLDAEFERIIAGWDAVAPDPTFAVRSADEATPSLETTTDTGTKAGSDAASEATSAIETERGDQPKTPDAPTRPGDPGPTDTPESPGPAGVLGFPIAPGAGHVWRGTARPHHDDDIALESVPSDDPDGDHFIPPTETDLPSAEDDPMFWAIVVGLAGGPLLLLYLVLFDRDGSGWWNVTALTMIGVGFILLVLRGGTERDPSDDGTRI
ncbi:MAG: hypothetical protein ABIQ53_00680 [Terracoccus sp.]